MSGTITAEEANKKAKVSPIWYIRTNWQHPNDPDPNRNYDFYDTEKQNALLYLTDEKSPLRPPNWNDINVLKICRGGLKTTTCVAICNWAVDVFPGIQILNTAPRSDQKGEVVDRFKEKVEMTDLKGRRVRNNIDHQKFKAELVDSNGEKTTQYSHFKSRSGWNEGEAIRGIHASLGVIDEFQDADEGMFSVFLEAIDQPIPQVDCFPSIFIIGTPKTEDSFFHDIWQMSDQKSWDGDSKEWVAESESDSYGRGSESYGISGWHLSQYDSPLHDDSRIQFKKEQYSKRKFQNEVIAEFYSPDDDLITSSDVHDNLIDKPFFDNRIHDDSKVAIGVDWGGGQRSDASKTSVSVVEKYDDMYMLLRHKFVSSDLTPQEEIEKVEDYIIRYQPEYCIADYGHGDKKLKDLQDGNGTKNPDGYPDIVKGSHYGNVKDKYRVKWNESERGNKRFFTVNRSFVMKSFVEDFKSGEFYIPRENMSFGGKRDVGTMLTRHLTAPYQDYKETPSGKKKTNIKSEKGRNDDAFHSLTYAWIGLNKLDNTRNVRKISSNNLRGV